MINIITLMNSANQILVQHDVLRFQVPMACALAVQIGHCRDQLSEVLTGGDLPTLAVLQVLEQLRAVDVLHHQAERVLVFRDLSSIIDEG